MNPPFPYCGNPEYPDTLALTNVAGERVFSMSESRTTYGRRVRALGIASRESEKVYLEDRDTFHLEIYRAYETGEWILEDLAREAGLSVSYVHKVIRQQAERGPGHDDL